MAAGVKSYFDLPGNYGANVRIYYEETYDTATNQSTVAITGIYVMSTWYLGVTYYLDGNITINGSTAMSMSSSSGSNRVTVSTINQYYASAGPLGSVSGITHNDNGSKTVAISATIRGYTTDGGAGSGWTASGSTNVALTTIPRKSTMTAPNGTLGIAQDLSVSRKASSFTHTITYKCGSATGTVCTQSADDTPTWTPPIDLAAQNTKGTTVKIDFTVTTYSGSTAVGSNTASAMYTIPATIAPKCSVTVSDYTGLDATYGAMIKNHSRLKVEVSTELSYGSAISTYEVKINGVTYTAPSFVTEPINAAGDVTIAVKVTDGRGRSDTTEATVYFFDYTQPAITLLKVKRCNEDGSDNDSGEYTQVTFSSRVTPLNDNNSAAYKLEYKKYAAEDYTEVYFPDLTDNYAVSEFAAILPADSSSSYHVRVTVTDDFTSHMRVTVVSTGATIMHWAANGRGMGIGKMSEADDTLDLGWNLKMNGHKITGLPDPTEDEDAVSLSYISGFGLGGEAATITNCNDVTDTGFYKWETDCENKPFGYGTMLVMNRTKKASCIQIACGMAGTYADVIALRRGNKSSGDWQEWAFVNPPMVLGTEYRTTEKMYGSPVYAKIINVGYVAAGAHQFSHSIANLYQPVEIRMFNNNDTVLNDYSGITSLYFDRSVIVLNTVGSLGNVNFILKYTKTT